MYVCMCARLCMYLCEIMYNITMPIMNINKVMPARYYHQIVNTKAT